MKELKRYFWNTLLTIDQAANVLLAPILNRVLDVECLFGDSDETLSSVFGKNRKICKACKWMCWLLDKIDSRHCSKSVEIDRGYCD